jgi:4-hydroxy-tetrahydrodipicolinate synthase
MERRLVAELALALVPPEKRTIIHIGASSCHEVLRLLEDAHRLGATEVAVITPYFLPTTRVAILDFFRRVSDSADGMKVYPYLYRQITRNEIDEDLLARIAELPHVAGAKITGETPERLGRYVASCPLGFDIYAGLDRHVAEVQRYGACGVIAAMSSALPWPFLRLASATSSGDEAGIRDAQDEVDTVCRVLNGDIARTKVALRIQGIPVGRPRLPLEEPSPVVTREIARVVSLYGLYPAGEH